MKSLPADTIKKKQYDSIAALLLLHIIQMYKVSLILEVVLWLLSFTLDSPEDLSGIVQCVPSLDISMFDERLRQNHSNSRSCHSSLMG